MTNNLRKVKKSGIIVSQETEVVNIQGNKTINLVLMDFKMPLINGFEATKQIKEFWPSIPIVAQTAYSKTN